MSNQTDTRALLTLLGIEKPIVQAPMAGVQLGALTGWASGTYLVADAAFLRASALSVFSQVNSGSERPKWPPLAVFR